MFCGAGNPPPCTAKNESPVSGITIVCRTAVTVIVTGTTMLCMGFALAMVTMPEYVPGPRPAGLAVMLTTADPNALNVNGKPVSVTTLPATPVR